MKQKTKNISIKKILAQNWQVYLLMLPVIAFYLIFCYFPMYGIVVAFKDFYPSRGILGSRWVGFVHFQWLFSQPNFVSTLRNTLVISFIKLVVVFPVPILIALLINEVISRTFKKFVQTAIYLPNFISWVIIASIMYSLLNYTGSINNFLEAIGIPRTSFLTNKNWFYPILIVSEIWKSAGWGTVMYLSAMSAINPELYEAAEVDGCKRFGKMVHITLPSILPIITILFIIAVGNVMNAGFDAVFNLRNPAVNSVANIIDTYAYDLGISAGEVERGAALGLFKTIINFILLIAANFIVKRINGYGLYE